MTEQHPSAGSDDFDAFSAPSPEPLDHTMVFAPVTEADPDDAAAVPQPAPTGFKQRITGLGRTRLAVAGVVAAAVLGAGAWAAAASTGSSANGRPVAGAAPTTTGATGGAAAPGAEKSKKSPAKKDMKAITLAITKVGVNTFTATDAKGRIVTVTYGGDTKFGNKARPLSADELAVGTTVTVLGERTGDSVTASRIAEPVKGKKAAKPATPTPTPSASSDS